MSNEKIAFIGFGLSGVDQFCTYVNEAISRQLKTTIIIYEKNAHRFATGFPYDINTPSFWTLNGPDSNGFRALSNGKTLQTWLNENREVWSKRFADIDEQYPPRALIGEHLKATYAEYKQKALANGIQVEERFEEVTNIEQTEQNHFLVQTEMGKIKVNFVGLGIGHLPSDNFLEFCRKPNFIDNPWNIKQLEMIPKDLNEIVMIGGHLTFIDIAKYLILAQQFKGTIISVTRHPSLILFRDNVCTIPPEPLAQLIDIFNSSKEKKLPLQKAITLFWETYHQSAKNPVKLNMNTLRAEVNTHTVLATQLAVYNKTTHPNLSAGDFSELLNFVKAFIATDCYKAMWNALSATDQKQFMKQFYSAIVSYLVGVPAQNAHFLKDMFDANRIQKISGLIELQFVEQTEEYSLKFNDGTEKRTKYLINATGQGLDITKHLDKFPLLEKLVRNGIVTATPYGILTNEFNQVINANGKPNINLIAVGPSAFNYGVPAPEGSLLINTATDCAFREYFRLRECNSHISNTSTSKAVAF